MTSRGRQLGKGSLFRLIQTFIGIAITLWIAPIIFESIGSAYPPFADGTKSRDAVYGVWKLAGDFMYYYGMLDLGLSSAIGRFISRSIGRGSPEEEKEIVDTGLTLYFWLSGAVMLFSGAVMLATPIFIKQPELHSTFRILVLLGGLSVAIMLPTRVFSGMLTARLRHDLISISSTIVLIVRYGLIWLFLRHGYGVIAMGSINLAATCAESTAFYCLARSYGVFKWSTIRLARTRMREIFSYSAITFYSVVADMLRNRADNLVIAVSRSEAEVTPYSFPAQLTQYASQIMQAMTGTVGTILSQEEGRGDFDSIRKKFLLLTKVSNILATLIFSGAAIYGTAFIRRWIPSELESTKAILLWLSLAAYVDMAQQPSVQVLYAISKHKYYAVANSIEGVLNLLLSVILVQRYGIVGVAAGTAIPSLLIRLIPQPVYTCRAIGLAPRVYIASLVKTLAPLLSFSLAFYFIIRERIEPAYGTIFLLAAIQCAFYFPLAWMLCFTPEERAYLAGYLRRRI